jgi:hypothetical protein
MNRCARTLALAALAVTVALTLCTSGPTGSAGTETTNGVTVATTGDTVSGRTIPGTMVLLFSADYLPHTGGGLADSTVAGADGSFSFGNVPAGSYTVIARNDSALLGAQVDSIEIGADPVVGDSVEFGNLFTLSGTVEMQGIGQPGAVVYVPASPYCDTAEALGEFSIGGVVPGSYRIIASYTEQVFGDEYADTLGVMLPIRDIEIILTLEPAGQ